MLLRLGATAAVLASAGANSPQHEVSSTLLAQGNCHNANWTPWLDYTPQTIVPQQLESSATSYFGVGDWPNGGVEQNCRSRKDITGVQARMKSPAPGDDWSQYSA